MSIWVDAQRIEAQVERAPLSLAQVRQIAADAFKGREGEYFLTLHRLEHNRRRDDVSTRDNVLGRVVEALNDANVPTEPTVGGVRETLKISFETLHDAICDCGHGGIISGARAAANFARIAQGAVTARHRIHTALY